jgi:hypothetical protein
MSASSLPDAAYGYDCGPRACITPRGTPKQGAQHRHKMAPHTATHTKAHAQSRKSKPTAAAQLQPPQHRRTVQPCMRCNTTHRHAPSILEVRTQLPAQQVGVDGVGAKRLLHLPAGGLCRGNQHGWSLLCACSSSVHADLPDKGTCPKRDELARKLTWVCVGWPARAGLTVHRHMWCVCIGGSTIDLFMMMIVAHAHRGLSASGCLPRAHSVLLLHALGGAWGGPVGRLVAVVEPA